MKNIMITGKAVQLYKMAHRASALLAVHDIQSIITGGFVRDVYFGLEPKDIDIFVSAGSENYATTHSEVFNVLHTYMPDADWHVFPFYDGDAHDDRIYSVYQSTKYCLDIILYRTDTTEEAVLACDDYINMITIDSKTGGFKYLGNKNIILPIQPVARESRKGRLEKMQLKRDAIMMFNKWYIRDETIVITASHIAKHTLDIGD